MHAGETFKDLQILGCELHKNVFHGRAVPGPAEVAVTPPNPLANIRGKGGRGRKGLGIVGSGRKGREEKDAKGYGEKGRDKGGSARLRYLSRGPRVPSYAIVYVLYYCEHGGIVLMGLKPNP